jgi:two-component system, NarL family, response regulator NreC
MPKIVLVEDHRILREGLRVLVEAQPDFSVIGEADDGIGVVDLVERLLPDVLIIDLMLPGISGLEVTRQVHERLPQIRVIILSMHMDDSYVLQALANGAMGYVLKDSSIAELVHAVNQVMQGQRYLSPPLSERAIEVYMQSGEQGVTDPFDRLTTREREVIHLAAKGFTNTKIAEQLSISPRTVEVHRGNMMRKLGLHSQADLIRYAIRRGILPADN